jgi:CheY-like chemotaxis protein
MKQKQPSTILLIDDDAATNFYHKLIISKSGIAASMHVAHHGKEAIDYLISAQNGKESMPDLIFLDINMPIMDGWEFLEQYKLLPADIREKITLVLLSASMNPGDAVRAKTFPEIAEFKNKPLTEEMVQDMVKTYFS